MALFTFIFGQKRLQLCNLHGRHQLLSLTIQKIVFATQLKARGPKFAAQMHLCCWPYKLLALAMNLKTLIGLCVGADTIASTSDVGSWGQILHLMAFSMRKETKYLPLPVSWHFYR
jgi:hypothetical protein